MQTEKFLLAQPSQKDLKSLFKYQRLEKNSKFGDLSKYSCWF